MYKEILMVMIMEKKELETQIFEDLKGDYEGVKKISMESDNEFLVFADDETLWKIFEDMIDEFGSIEFDAEKGETHFLRINI
jgi:hypothetical protein